MLYTAIAVVVIMAYPILYRLSSDTITVTVKSKERAIKGHGKEARGKYMIYCKEEVLECTDSWTFMKFNSSDQYAKLCKDKKYRVFVAGWRIPFMSMYRNVIRVVEGDTRSAEQKLADKMSEKYQGAKDVQKRSPDEVFRDIKEMIRTLAK